MLNLICFELTTSGLVIHFRSLRFSQKPKIEGNGLSLGCKERPWNSNYLVIIIYPRLSKDQKITVTQIQKYGL